MPTYKLSYIGSDVNGKLSIAHKHTNLSALNKITDDTLAKINNADEAINNVADKSLVNVSASDLEKAIKKTDLWFVNDVDNGDGDMYVRKYGEWKRFSDAMSSYQLKSSTLDINGVNVNLKSADVEKINSVLNKMDKITGATTNNVVVTDSTGNAASSSISINEVISSNSLIHDVTKDSSPLKALSAKGGKAIYDKIESLSAGIGRPRGVVCNAFTSQGTGSGINANQTINSSTTGYTISTEGGGYEENELVTLVCDNGTIIPAKGVVVSVNSGKITSLAITDSGVYNRNIADGTNEAVFVIQGTRARTGSDASYSTLTVSKNSLTTAYYTVLDSIESPAVGDTCYVIQDENSDLDTSLYSYEETTGSSIPGRQIYQWVKMISFTGGTDIYR